MNWIFVSSVQSRQKNNRTVNGYVNALITPKTFNENQEVCLFCIKIGHYFHKSEVICRMKQMTSLRYGQNTKKIRSTASDTFVSKQSTLCVTTNKLTPCKLTIFMLEKSCALFEKPSFQKGHRRV